MTASETQRPVQPLSLRNKRILIAEDEFFIADEMALDFKCFGAEVIGPVASLAEALDVLERDRCIDAAVLDINLQGETVYPLADALGERGVPFVFSTGYERQWIPEVYKDIPLCEKPVNSARLARILFM